MILAINWVIFLLLPLVSDACTTVSTTGGTEFPEPCIFPFTNKGKTYNSCTRDLDPDNRLWCSVETDGNGNHVVSKGRWGHCDPDLCNRKRATTTPRTTTRKTTSTTRRTTRPTQRTPRPTQVSNKNVNNRGETCSTISGKRSDQPCVFPFTFRNQTFRDCTLEFADDDKRWCSVRTNSAGAHQQGQWGHCECIKTGNQRTPDCNGEVSSNRGKQIGASGAILPNQGQCYSENQNFVINGVNATVNEIPFIVLLAAQNKREPGKFHYICGGSLINRRYVLTAAHCLDGIDIDHVVLGELDITNECDCTKLRVCSSPVQKISVIEKILHEDWPKFKTGNRHGDIGLLRLTEPAELNASVQPVCLPLDPTAVAEQLNITNLAEGLNGKNLTVAGWGRTQYDSIGEFFTAGVSSTILQKVVIPSIDTDSCIETVKNTFNVELDGTTQICAGKLNFDSCKGDSGGPLYSIGNTGFVYQLGLVSFGSRRCGNGSPGVYTRMTGYTDWIRSKIRR